MSRLDRERLRHVWLQAREGPAAAAHAYARARRRRHNVADEDLELSPSDRLVWGGALDADSALLERAAQRAAAYSAADSIDIPSLQWFIPAFHNVHGGGVHTILRFADRFTVEHGVENRFCVYDEDDPSRVATIAAKIAAAFPALAAAPVIPAGAPLAGADAAVATTWASAFSALRFESARTHFFFLADHEPAFFPAGAASAVLEQAATFGFAGIANTPALADSYRAYGNLAVSFTPAVDTAVFHPRTDERRGGPLRIFFYGRPATARNAFGLGVAALSLVKERHGDAVEIVSAGEAWSPGQYGLADVMENRGALVSLDELADLYRSCAVGVSFMMTRHPSYVPLELMASGAAVVANENPYTAWLLHDEENCLLARALPSLVAEQVTRLVDDAALRERLARAGLESATAASWPAEIDRVWAAMTKRGPGMETLAPARRSD